MGCICIISIGMDMGMDTLGWICSCIGNGLGCVFVLIRRLCVLRYVVMLPA
jgi:hypothetical protein